MILALKKIHEGATPPTANAKRDDSAPKLDLPLGKRVSLWVDGARTFHQVEHPDGRVSWYEFVDEKGAA